MLYEVNFNIKAYNLLLFELVDNIFYNAISIFI